MAMELLHFEGIRTGGSFLDQPHLLGCNMNTHMVNQRITEGSSWTLICSSSSSASSTPSFSSAFRGLCEKDKNVWGQRPSLNNIRRRSFPCNAAKWADRLSRDLHATGSLESSVDDSTESISLPSSSNRANGKKNGAISSSSFPALTERSVPLPLDYYQVLGADTHFLADSIVRAYESRAKNLPKEGFSQDALISRQEILRGACETLADPELRGEYNEGLVNDASRTLMVDVPLSKVPGALCLLQEVGEMEVVIKVGQELLRERLGKFFQRDIVLAMALAYVELSRDAMAESPPAVVESCELLERALKLLQEEGGSSLAPNLQEQIDETLQQINPRCILELLALPLDKEYHGKREEGLQGLRSILWAVGEGGVFARVPGYTRDEYMKAAFSRMTAAEQVALFTNTPSNIPAESSEVYTVALAHIAEGFVAKKPQLIQEADSLFLQLQRTNASSSSLLVTGGLRPLSSLQLDFAFERAMCKLLLGELDGCRAWLGLDDTNSPYRDPAVTDFVIANSFGSEEGDYLPGLCKLLESWLREVVFSSFRETENLNVKLRDYYDDAGVLSYLEKLEKGDSPLAAAAAIVQIGHGAGAALDSVKERLQKVFPLGKVGINRYNRGFEDIDTHVNNAQQTEALLNGSQAEIPMSLGEEDKTTQGTWNSFEELEGKETKKSERTFLQIACAGALIAAAAFGAWKVIFTAGSRHAFQKGPVASAKVTQLSDLEQRTPKMDAMHAEELVQKWQVAKAHALGPDHAVEKLSEILDGSMLKSWSDRASHISKNGWCWEYKFTDLNIESVTISTDGRKATVEATLREAANLYDERKLEVIDSYDSTYTTKYELSVSNGHWKIVSGAVLRS
ncbi:hypothetical protein KP509_39G026700 [Ceratopteris richardii]|uniref:ARC6 IMS domain-containing protein n=1 Tax=Ceratopteris richardii TaxID=49495 RepID=A0A8T2PZB9_CERRI|nr:hypothetical protein KP509_39G026700 [Ceratopteris richardii]